MTFALPRSFGNSSGSIPPGYAPQGGLGASTSLLIETIHSMRYIRESHALFFTGDPASLKEISALLQGLDAAISTSKEGASQGFYIYPIQYGTEEQIRRSLEKFSDNLENAEHPDENLIDAISSMKWIRENDSLLFMGDPKSIETLKTLLPTFDTPINQGKTAQRIPLSNEFYVYKPKYQYGENLLGQIKDIYKNLKDSDLADPSFLHALNSARWVSSTNSLIFTGDPASLDRVHSLLAVIDQFEGGPTGNVYIFKIEERNPDEIEDALKKVTQNLPKEDPLREVIESKSYISETNSFVFHGAPPILSQVKALLGELSQTSASTDFYVYQPNYISASELSSSLQQVAEDMKATGLADPDLIRALKECRVISDENALLFTGSKEAIGKVKDLLLTFDALKENGKAATGKTTFLIFKIKYVPGPILMSFLRNMALDLQKAGSAENGLIKCLENMRYVKDTNSIIFTGTPNVLARAKALATQFDNPSLGGETAQRTPAGFVLFKPKFVPGPELIHILSDFEQNLINFVLNVMDKVLLKIKKKLNSKFQLELKTIQLFVYTVEAIQVKKVDQMEICIFMFE